jgi:hypothetical protein
MRRLPAYLITTLPLVASQIFLPPDISATAGEFTPLATVELLSKSHAADSKCKFLDLASHEELGGYVVHVERAAAEIEGKAAAQTAFMRGFEAGKSAQCSPQSAAQTLSSLKAARRAMAAARDTRIPDAQIVAGDGRKSPLSILPATGELAVHEQRMMAYFTELHCNHLAYRQRWKFWKAIVAQHEAAAGRFGPETAESAKERAQRNSASLACGEQTAGLVRAQYREITGK